MKRLAYARWLSKICASKRLDDLLLASLNLQCRQEGPVRQKSETAAGSSSPCLSLASRITAWYEHERDDGRALRILLALFVVIWSLFQIIAFRAGLLA